jgi:hypothetical protein
MQRRKEPIACDREKVTKIIRECVSTATKAETRRSTPGST